MRTAQQIFDTVADHLRKQKVQSTIIDTEGGVGCVYRDPFGHSCAVGCLIPDEFYSRKMEGHRVVGLIQEALLPISLSQEFEQHVLLLHDLQHVHDTHDPSTWETYLKVVADRYDLSFTVSEVK